MNWFGLLANSTSYDNESDTGSDEPPAPDLEKGLETNDNENSTAMMSYLDPASNTITTSSIRSSSRPCSPSNVPEPRMISFRPLKGRDRKRIQELHEEWFPVRYTDEFYTELVNNHRLSTSGDALFTSVATLDNEPSLYCQEAGQASLPEAEDEIMGCIVGSFLHRSRLNPETANLLLPNLEQHFTMFYIMTLGTVKEYRNYGIATLLVEQCMQQIEADPSCGVLYLHVIPFNHAAINFYEKLGFYRVCTINNYYNIDDKYYDCYLYAKYFHGETLLIHFCHIAFGLLLCDFVSHSSKNLIFIWLRYCR